MTNWTDQEVQWKQFSRSPAVHCFIITDWNHQHRLFSVSHLNKLAKVGSETYNYHLKKTDQNQSDKDDKRNFSQSVFWGNRSFKDFWNFFPLFVTICEIDLVCSCECKIVKMQRKDVQTSANFLIWNAFICLSRGSSGFLFRSWKIQEGNKLIKELGSFYQHRIRS